MAAKTNADVIIGGKVYTLSGYESAEYLQKVASYINGKINDFDSAEEYRHLPTPMKATLVQLNIADDYFKVRAQVEKLEAELEGKEKEIYDLKHELISSQVRMENAEESAKNLESQKQELLLNKARLEASLEDKLLGGKKGSGKNGDRGNNRQKERETPNAPEGGNRVDNSYSKAKH